jgi:hypothetical protein
MTDPRTPRTEAGRALFSLRVGEGMERSEFLTAILAIEAEASTLGSSERLAAALEYYFGKLPLVTQHGLRTPREVADALLADPALSDPDAERQRAIGEPFEQRVYSILDAQAARLGRIEHVLADLRRAALPAAQEPER